MGVINRFKNAWNTFLNRDPTDNYKDVGGGYSYRPDRIRFSRGNERSIVTALYNRIAIDVSSIDIRHVDLDKNERYVSDRDSYLNDCLKYQANKDQTSQAFIQDCVMSLFDEGHIAIVPVDTDKDPRNGGFDVESMRVGQITAWYPDNVRVKVYNDRKGIKQEILIDKTEVCIIENPFYAIMNEPNSTLQRLIRKLNLLDAIDEQSGSGKLDLIIQLPYIIKSEARRQQADQRRKDIEKQLSGSKYGIAYTDGTERITQLNRPVENNLLKQIEYLTAMVYSQLGITQTVLDGSADEQTMLNYMSRTIKPIIEAIVNEMNVKFLTQTARTQKQRIMYFKDPFELVPVNNIAEIADKFTRNEIMTSNEIRQIVGMKPSDDPKADQLINSNLNHNEEKPEDESSEGEKDIKEDKKSKWKN